MIVVLAALAGCARDGSVAGITDEQFIATMVELRRAAHTAGQDTARFEALRDEVLAEHGVSADDLKAHVEARSRDLDELAALWDSVNARLSSGEPQ